MSAPWEIRVGDCRELLRAMPDRSVQCVVTSPPYFGLRDYGVDGQLGLERTPQEYVTNMVEVFREVRRVLRDDGTLWLNLGDSYANDEKWGGYSGGKHAAGLHGATGVGRAKRLTGLKPKDLVGIPWRVAFALQADGWYLRADIIWSKPNPMPESVEDRPTKAHEYVFLLAKSPRYYYDAEAIKEPASFDGPNAPNAIASPYGQGFTRRAKSGNTTRKLGPERGRPDSHLGASIPWEGLTRNKRSVWTIATQPFPEAHFATYPPALVEPCILAGTSARGACPACGAPWRRVMEREFVPQPDVSLQRGVRGAEDQKPMDASSGWEGFPRGLTSTRTTDWSPACACDAGEPVPCVVLDPFAGAGTTGLVARRLGRRFVGIELNPTYAAMAERRIVGDAPLLNGGVS